MGGLVFSLHHPSMNKTRDKSCTEYFIVVVQLPTSNGEQRWKSKYKFSVYHHNSSNNYGKVASGTFFSAVYNKYGRLLLNAYLFSFSFFELVSLPQSHAISVLIVRRRLLKLQT